MRILVACEFSGVVRDAFIAKGHDAISADIAPSMRPGPHYQDDVREILDQSWDMILGFPPCTHLASIGSSSWAEKQSDGRQQKAIEFFLQLYDAAPLACIENPVGWMNTNWRKPDQIINPYQFGDPWKKRTCLWLKGLPALIPTNVVIPSGAWIGGQRSGPDRKYKIGQGGQRNSRLRSITFQGIANAMADQWGSAGV